MFACSLDLSLPTLAHWNHSKHKAFGTGWDSVVLLERLLIWSVLVAGTLVASLHPSAL